MSNLSAREALPGSRWTPRSGAVAAALVYLCAFTSIPAYSVQFDSPFRTFPSGSGTSYGLAIGDFTGDGRPDIYVGHSSLNYVSKWASTGGGNLEGAGGMVSNIFPAGIILVDLARDGIPDLVSCNYDSDNLRVFPDAGSGSYTLTIGDAPVVVGAGDFNGDGYVDLVATNSKENTISVLLSLSGTGFEYQTKYPTTPDPQGLAMGDFNSDGLDDVAVVGSMVPNPINVFLSQAGGTLAPRVEYPICGPQSLVSLDVDLDGDIDLVAADCGAVGGSASSVQVLTNDGTGHFFAGGKFGIAEGGGVTSGDLNGDGNPDLVTRSSSTHSVTVLLGAGNGTFGGRADFDMPAGSANVAFADVSGEGYTDIIMAAGSSLCVFLNRGGGNFGPKVIWPAGDGPTGVASGLLDGDGRSDFVVCHGYDSSIGVFLSDAAGAPLPPQYYPTLYPQGIALSDMDLDGTLDVLTASYGTNSVSILKGLGGGTFDLPQYYGVGSGPWKVATGDLNGDAFPDVAATCRTANLVSVWLGNGPDGLLSRADYSTGTQPEGLAIGDLDQDGDRDLVVACYGGGGRVSILRNNGNGTFAPKVNFNSGSITEDVTLGDYNEDGKVDLAVANSTGLGIMLGNGAGSFAAPVNLPLFSAKAIETADLNRDGHLDIVLPNYGTSSTTVMLGNGQAGFTDRMNYGGGYNGVEACVGDANGDGWLDVATANLMSDTITILLNNGLAASGVPEPGDGGAGTPPPLALSAAIPNPFFSSTGLWLSAAQDQSVEVWVADVSGRRIRKLGQRAVGPMPLLIQWDGRSDGGARLGAGVYWVVAQSRLGRASQRLTLVR